MTIDEAKAILEKDKADHHSFPTDVIGKAEGLGIEALKRVLLYRKGMYIGLGDEMPGETR